MEHGAVNDSTGRVFLGGNLKYIFFSNLPIIIFNLKLKSIFYLCLI